MNLVYKSYLLEFHHPFGLSSNTRKETPTAFLRLGQDGLFGYGEACLPAYLGDTFENTIAFFESAKVMLEFASVDSSHPSELLSAIKSRSSGNNAAKAAIDIALHDLWGKINGRSCHELFGLTLTDPAITSFTIAIDSEEKIGQKIKEAADFKVLKIKAGTKDDKSLIRVIRKFTDKPLYVDVNQGWHDKHFVLEMIHWMKDQNVVLLEQPMPKTLKEEMKWLTKQSPIPLIADESVQGMADLESLHGSFSGINIKLMKCSGLHVARQMITFAKKQGLKVMLGCMAESSCGISAMAQLMSLGDHIDLDAPLLYRNDPFSGVNYIDGKVCLPTGNGIGAIPQYDVFD
jgi:L-alanine-DL-glutamate epimerase-like enolase superfamily enzyme